MNIYSLQIGYGAEVQDKISLNIYLSGCLNNKNCERSQCHNPELKDFESGLYYTLLLNNISGYLKSDLMKCFVILGGEPLDQDINLLIKLIKYLKEQSDIPIYIYSGYEYEEQHEIIDMLFKKGIKGFCLGAFRKNKEKKWMYI